MDIFLCQNMRNNKNKHSGGVSYAIDCRLNSITGMHVVFLLTVSPPFFLLYLSCNACNAVGIFDPTLVPGD